MRLTLKDNRVQQNGQIRNELDYEQNAQNHLKKYNKPIEKLHCMLIKG